jgi:hypothetical protein
LDHHSPTHHYTTTFKALPDILGSWFLPCNLILTQLERRPQKQMEDDLQKQKIEDNLQNNFFLKFRPKIEKEDDLKKMEDGLQKKWKMTSTKKGRRPLQKMEDDLNKILNNGRRHQAQLKIQP